MIELGAVQQLLIYAITGGRDVAKHGEHGDLENLLNAVVSSAIDDAAGSENLDDAPTYMKIPWAFRIGVRMATAIINAPLSDHHTLAADELEAYRVFVEREADVVREDRLRKSLQNDPPI